MTECIYTEFNLNADLYALDPTELQEEKDRVLDIIQRDFNQAQRLVGHVARLNAYMRAWRNRPAEMKAKKFGKKGFKRG